MYDIYFYRKISKLKRRLMNGERLDKDYVFGQLEKCRAGYPVIYSIETTNACNLHCAICPRTTMMKRRIGTLDMDTFRKIAQQIKPFSKAQWQQWEGFAQKEYGIAKNEMSENHFFLFIIPKVIVLHGYGDPLLDENMAERVKILAKRNIPTYFSCHPANIEVEKLIEILKNGLDYLKFSGETFDFPDFHKKILHLLAMEKRHQYKTSIIISMVDCNKPGQKEEFRKLKTFLRKEDVYIYWKSQDQRWYRQNQAPIRSVHWLEFCQFPWSSISIQSNGKVVQCECDLNTETLVGDAKTESLDKIWNGPRCRKFRQGHFNLKPKIKCALRCDRQLVGKLVNN